MSRVGKNVGKDYACPQGGCQDSFSELIVLRGHVVLEHGLFFRCSEKDWEEAKKGKVLKTVPANKEQSQWGWCKVNHRTMEDFAKAVKDQRINDWGRPTGVIMGPNNSLIGMTGGLVSFPSPYIPQPLTHINGIQNGTRVGGTEKVKEYFPSKTTSKSCAGKENVIKTLGTRCIPSGEIDLMEARRVEEIQLFEKFKLQRKQALERYSGNSQIFDEQAFAPTLATPLPCTTVSLNTLIEDKIAEVGPDMLTREQLFAEILEVESSEEKKRKRELDEAVLSIM